MKKSVRKVLACSLAAAVALSGLGNFGVASAAKKKVKKITMKDTTVLVKVKGKVTLKVKSVKPAKASKKVTYKVANKKIASVSKKGVVKGKKVGTTTVKVISKSNKKATAKVKVMVAKKVPTKVTLDNKTLKLEPGKDQKLKATVKGKGVKKAHKKVTWSTSKKSVAKVNKSGKVTAVATGSATITVKTLNGKTAKCTVTVAASAAAVATQPAATSAAPVQTTQPAPSQMPGESTQPSASTQPTNAPTQAPTEEPTQAPTEEPTQAPTETPATVATSEAITADADGNYTLPTSASSIVVKYGDKEVKVSKTALDKFATETIDAAKVAEKYVTDWVDVDEKVITQEDTFQGLTLADFGIEGEVKIEGDGATKTVTNGDDVYTVTVNQNAEDEYAVSVEGQSDKVVKIVDENTIEVTKDGEKFATASNKDGKLVLNLAGREDVSITALFDAAE